MHLNQFSLLHTASPETLAWLQDQVTEREFVAGRVVLMEEAWGNAVYLVRGGWLKVRSLGANQEPTTLAVLGRGDIFGEMAVLDESPRSTDVVAYTDVQVYALTANIFLELLTKDPKVSLQMLRMMAQRVRRANHYRQVRQQVPAVKLANLLVSLANSYGEELFLFPLKDMADLVQAGGEEISKIIQKLQERAWLKIDPSQHLLHILHLKQLQQLAETRT